MKENEKGSKVLDFGGLRSGRSWNRTVAEIHVSGIAYEQMEKWLGCTVMSWDEGGPAVPVSPPPPPVLTRQAEQVRSGEDADQLPVRIDHMPM